MGNLTPGDRVPDINFEGADGVAEVLRDVTFLAHASSRRASHYWQSHPAGERFAAEGQPCQACRWFEVFLYRATDGRYALVTAGVSAVPGEETRARTRVTDSPFEVVEHLTQHERGRAARLPRASALVLARAAQHDDGIAEAYVNRAVA